MLYHHAVLSPAARSKLMTRTLLKILRRNVRPGLRRLVFTYRFDDLAVSFVRLVDGLRQIFGGSRR